MEAAFVPIQQNPNALYADDVRFDRNRAALANQNKYGAAVERTIYAVGTAFQAIASAFAKGATFVAAGIAFTVCTIIASPVYLAGAVAKLLGDRTLKEYAVTLEVLDVQGGALDFAPLNQVVRTQRDIDRLVINVDIQAGTEMPSIDDLETTLNKLGRNVRSVYIPNCQLESLKLHEGSDDVSPLKFRWIAADVVTQVLVGEEQDGLNVQVAQQVHNVQLTRKEVVKSLTLCIDAKTEKDDVTATLARASEHVEFQNLKIVFIGDVDAYLLRDIQETTYVGQTIVVSHADGAVGKRYVDGLKKAMGKDIATLNLKYPAPQAPNNDVEGNEGNNVNNNDEDEDIENVV